MAVEGLPALSSGRILPLGVVLDLGGDGAAVEHD